MGPILNAKEFWDKMHDAGLTVEETMIEFATAHVQACKADIKQKIPADAMETYGSEVSDCWSLDSVDNAYSLENIK